jgi:uncharacterized protein YbaR (Trm112 family)
MYIQLKIHKKLQEKTTVLHSNIVQYSVRMKYIYIFIHNYWKAYISILHNAIISLLNFGSHQFVVCVHRPLNIGSVCCPSTKHQISLLSVHKMSGLSLFVRQTSDEFVFRPPNIRSICCPSTKRQVCLLFDHQTSGLFVVRPPNVRCLLFVYQTSGMFVVRLPNIRSGCCPSITRQVFCCSSTKRQVCLLSVHQTSDQFVVRPPNIRSVCCPSTKRQVCLLSVHQTSGLFVVRPPNIRSVCCPSTKHQVCLLSVHQTPGQFVVRPPNVMKTTSLPVKGCKI